MRFPIKLLFNMTVIKLIILLSGPIVLGFRVVCSNLKYEFQFGAFVVSVFFVSDRTSLTAVPVDHAIAWLTAARFWSVEFSFLTYLKLKQDKLYLFISTKLEPACHSNHAVRYNNSKYLYTITTGVNTEHTHRLLSQAESPSFASNGSCIAMEE